MSDRFMSRRPTFKPPTNSNSLEVITPKRKENSPASSVLTHLSATRLSRVEAPKFKPEHRLTDEEFIKQTRANNIHDPEMKALFYANGGQDFMKGSITYAQAFDMLRNHKLHALKSK